MHWQSFIKKHWIPITLSFLAFLIYASALGNDFVSDDRSAILFNQSIGDFDRLINRVRGITSESIKFAIYHIAGKTPWAFRLSSLIFHSINTALIFLILKKFAGKYQAIIVSLLFAVHPILAESVVWISADGYIHSSTFVLLSLFFYIKSNSSGPRYWYAVLFYLLALISSEKTIGVFLVFLLYEWLFSEKNAKKYIKVIPFFIFSFASGLQLVGLLPSRISGLATDYYQESGIENPFIQIPIAITEYLKMIFWPSDLTLYHTELSFSTGQYLIRLVVFIIFIGFIVRSFIKSRQEELPLKVKKRRNIKKPFLTQKDHKYIIFWLSFFVISLLPTLTPFRISWIVAERYVYLGSIGIFAVIGLFISKLAKYELTRIAVYTLFGLIIIALATRTIYRNMDWRNEDTLWIATVKSSPSSPNAHNNMGDVYSRSGDYENAALEFEKAIELKPNYADAYHNLAVTYEELGKDDKAIENYHKAIEINPNIWQSYRNLAVIYERQGELEKAQEYLQIAETIFNQFGFSAK